MDSNSSASRRGHRHTLSPSGRRAGVRGGHRPRNPPSGQSLTCEECDIDAFLQEIVDAASGLPYREAVQDVSRPQPRPLNPRVLRGLPGREGGNRPSMGSYGFKVECLTNACKDTPSPLRGEGRGEGRSPANALGFGQGVGTHGALRAGGSHRSSTPSPLRGEGRGEGRSSANAPGISAVG